MTIGNHVHIYSLDSPCNPVEIGALESSYVLLDPSKLFVTGFDLTKCVLKEGTKNIDHQIEIIQNEDASF